MNILDGNYRDSLNRSFVKSEIRPEPGRSIEVATPDLRKTSFNEVKTVSRFTQIDLQSSVTTISALRNNTIPTGGGTASVSSSGEYVLNTQNSGDKIIFDSGERGRYIPGYEAECGVGVRLDSSEYTGDDYALWGYFDDDNGLGFGVDSSGIFVFRRSGGVEEKTYQGDWNKDSLDGAGRSLYNLDLKTGSIFEIEFNYYGYGGIQFTVSEKNTDLERASIPRLLHVMAVNNEVSLQQPNLPIRVELSSGTTSNTHNVFVGGRQFSVYGEKPGLFRITGDYRQNIALTTNTWVPLISFKRKSGVFSSQPVKIDEAEVIADDIVAFTFVLDGTLTGASFGNLTDSDPNETVLQSDTSATAITGGTFFGGVYIVNGGGKGVPPVSIQGLNFDFVNTKSVTLVAKSFAASKTVNLCSFNCRELW